MKRNYRKGSKKENDNSYLSKHDHRNENFSKRFFCEMKCDHTICERRLFEFLRQNFV